MKITFLVSGSIRSNFSYRPLALAKSLHKLGHDVSIITPRADKYNNFVPEHVVNIAGVRILQPFQFATKNPVINLLPYLFGAARMLLKEHPDLVYIYKPTPVSVVGLIAKLFRRTETVADYDDLGSEVMRIEGHPAYQRKLVQWSEELSAKYADRLIVASTYLADMYRHEYSDKPILIIPNGVESDWFDPVIPSAHPKRIVFMGAMNRRNILQPLFDVLPYVISKHPDVEVLMIGDGTFLPYFKEKAIELNITKNIVFTGWLPLEKAKMQLHAGDIGYNYMPYEITTRAASNMKVPQYMARGIVTLVSDLGDLSATVDHGRAGYIAKADDILSLRNTLFHALEDTDKRKKSEYARSFAIDNLDWQKLAQTFSKWAYPVTEKNKQNIYIVATSVPGDVGGAEIRNYNLIKQLIKQTGADIDVFCISPDDPESVRKAFESRVAARCHVVPSYQQSSMTITRDIAWNRIPSYMGQFNSSGLGNAVRQACERSLPDIVHVEQLHAYYCIRPHISWLKSKGVKIIFDCHNIEWKNFMDSLEIFPFSKKLVGRYLTPRLKRLEIEAAKRSNIILTCSKADANFFKKYNSQTYIIPNGVDCSEFPVVPQHNEHMLIFMGGMSYPPNADAMKWYITAIHPQIKKQVPDVQLLAIGTDEPWFHSLGIHDISIKRLGFVPDVHPYLSQATIGICPIRYGSGTRIKILTYMAAGLPVVSTTKGAEGVGYTGGVNIIMADEPKQFAKAIMKLLTDQTYRDKIAHNGREFVEKNYDWNIIGKDLVHIYHHD